MKRCTTNIPSLFDNIPEKTNEAFVVNINASFKDSFYFYLNLTDINPHKADILGICLCRDSKDCFYVPINHVGERNVKNALEILKPIFESPEITKISHDIKSQMIALRKKDIYLKGTVRDIMIGSYLIDPNKSNHQIDSIALTYLNKNLNQKNENWDKKSLQEHAEDSAQKVSAIKELDALIFKKLVDEGLNYVYQDVEMPLIEILANMELIGILIDLRKLSELSSQLDEMLQRLQYHIFEIVGEDFNINSTRQLANILFEKLKLKPIRKTKTGFSTDNETLQQLAVNHELPKEILNYRMLFKLKSTYIDALPPLVDSKTGRLHTTFHQAVTATGRLSSSDPNLQNIPARGEWGSRIRQAFVAEKDAMIISADYSQIELRILAHLSGDERLINAFKNDRDIHNATASLLFNIPEEKIMKEMRRIAKVVNFGIIYGMSPFGLSEALKITPSEASEYINNYFRLYYGVKDFIDKCIKIARQKGYAETIFGRKRAIVDINSSNSLARQQAERLAVNTPIQGSSADLIKIAMINVSNALKTSNLKTKMILQIHDELLFESPIDEVLTIKEIIKKEMQSAVILKVPLKVDINSAKNWGDAH
ncbi:MAG TPA: DNA polymerase I [Nitrospirae bacterium]|nr:DNA polymerase I [Nitrospirota bacterium]